MNLCLRLIVVCLVTEIALISALLQVNSLKRGKWMKFISGASNQDLPHISNLCFLYTLAGVDCIDLSADLAVLCAANEGIQTALKIGKGHIQKPWVMISVNDGQDAHFRKAYFDPTQCPPSCPRPCEKVCPALAIGNSLMSGVEESKCYGCGRCLPACPLKLIQTVSHQTSTTTIQNLLQSGDVDAVEIHTQLQDACGFQNLWKEIGEVALSHSKAISVSFPDKHHDTIDALSSIQATMSTLFPTQYKNFGGVHIWQADGRPMSGDVGVKATSKAAISLAKKLLVDNRARLREAGIDFDSGRHFVQLAGGVNSFTPSLSNEEGMSEIAGFGGFAFGGFARKQLLQYFERQGIQTLNHLIKSTDISESVFGLDENRLSNAFPLEFSLSIVDSVKL